MLITLEGIDGSGKTTAWEALQDTTGADAPLPADAVFTREPSETWYGENVRRSLSDPDADPLAELFLFTADHADHLSRVVRPALESGQVVVSDRYSDSRYAYQAASLEGEIDRPMEYIKSIHGPFTRTPDATIYFDVPAEVGAARAGATDKLEREGYLERVHANYERLIEAEPERFVHVDATRSPEAVIASVEAAVERILEA
jgi:dTMP kinase